MEETKKTGGLWNDMLKPVVVLVVICLVASAALGFTNSKTEPIITENKNAAAGGNPTAANDQLRGV